MRVFEYTPERKRVEGTLLVSFSDANTLYVRTPQTEGKNKYGGLEYRPVPIYVFGIPHSVSMYVSADMQGEYRPVRHVYNKRLTTTYGSLGCEPTSKATSVLYELAREAAQMVLDSYPDERHNARIQEREDRIAALKRQQNDLQKNIEALQTEIDELGAECGHEAL